MTACCFDTDTATFVRDARWLLLLHRVLRKSLLSGQWQFCQIAVHVSLLCRYDEAHGDMEASKDEKGRHRDVEEDAFQKKVAAYLSARPVAPEDKSFKAYRTRFR